MKHRISHISVHRTALMVAIMYGLLGLLFVPIFWLMAALNPREQMPLVVTILFPVLYAVVGYVFSAVGFIIYNLVAGQVGGVEFTLTPVDEPYA
jgi:hypothetical protein